MRLPFLLLFITTILTLTHSCSPGKAEDNDKTTNRESGVPSPVTVTTAPAATKTFHHELLCNGTVEAGRMARLGFELAGIIESIPVANDQVVERGQTLAKLHSQEQELALERARTSLQRAQLEMKDLLLGYSATADTANLPPQLLLATRIRSGLAEAELSVRELELQLAKTVIKAPIAGRIVDLTAKPHNPTGSYKFFCHIVDEGSLRVVFNVLESELELAKEGSGVEVYPFSNPTQRSKGTITEVNRMVDKDGMVRVIASISNGNRSIIPGMRVRVLVRRAVPNQLVIPVDGLTRRQNRDVVFVLRDSLAHWQYVEVGPRNTQEVVIHSGVEEGQRVIVTGNATIGHEAWVREEGE